MVPTVGRTDVRARRRTSSVRRGRTDPCTVAARHRLGWAARNSQGRLLDSAPDMGPLAAVERFLERLFEGQSARLFHTGLRPIQVQRRLERAMESQRIREANRTIVPHRLVVRLSPPDLTSLRAASPTLAADLADAALDRRIGPEGDARSLEQGVGMGSCVRESRIGEARGQARCRGAQRGEVVRRQPDDEAVRHDRPPAIADTVGLHRPLDPALDLDRTETRPEDPGGLALE